MEEVVEGLFRRLREVPVEPPPYLRTRIFAQLDQETRRPRLLALVSSLAGVLAVATFVFVLSADPRYDAVVAQPFAVRIALKSSGLRDVTRAEIEVPGGVQFPLPEPIHQNRLRLRWKPDAERPVFAFVLKSDTAGAKKIVVRFKDDRGRVIEEHKLRVDLRPASGTRTAKWGTPTARIDDVDPVATRDDIESFDQAVNEGYEK